MKRSFLPSIVALALCAMCGQHAFAQPGSLDPTFTIGTGFSNGVSVVALQPDGKIMVGGGSTMFNGVSRNYIARLNGDGTLDTGFDPGSGFDNSVVALALQPDGKVIAAGGFHSYNGTAGLNRIVRIDAVGAIDPSFNSGTGFNATVFALALLSDGSVIAAGDFTSYNGVSCNRIAKLDPSGTIDASFSAGGGIDSYRATALAVQPDDKIIAVGTFFHYNGTPVMGVVRLNSDGSIDAGFNLGTAYFNNAQCVKLQPDGKILLGATHQGPDGTYHQLVVRLFANGDRDPSFDSEFGFDSLIYALAVQPDGRIIVGGLFNRYKGSIVSGITRLNSNGSRDAGFAPPGCSSFVNSLAQQPDGKVILGGGFNYVDLVAQNCIARLLEDCTTGAACNDLNSATANDVYDASCVCAGTPINCTTNPVHLTLNTDEQGGWNYTSWEIVDLTTQVTACSGTGYPSSSTIVLDCCLPNGCYTLRVLDSQGDGILLGGGYVLTDLAGHRFIDNTPSNGTWTVSESWNCHHLYLNDPLAQPLGFCMPLTNTRSLEAGYGCDQMDLTPIGVIKSQIDPAVLAGSPAHNLITGYSFWIFDPNGNYARRMFQSIKTPGAAGIAATTMMKDRPAYFALSLFQLGNGCSPPLPLNTLLNVRVRSRIDGVDQGGVETGWGPACRIKVVVPPCSTTQLTTTAAPMISCGATVNLHTSSLYANAVAGACKYQFEFVRHDNGAFLRNLGSTTKQLKLSTWGSTMRPVCGVAYDVRVHVSFDCVTYCPFGATCQVTFTNCPSQQPRSVESNEESDQVSIWPNPNSADQLFIAIDDLGEEISTASIDIMDVFGKRVMGETVPVDGSTLNTVLDLKNGLSDGLYVVNITATDKSGQGGERVFTQRLVISR